jgi:hypothetical protein
VGLNSLKSLNLTNVYSNNKKNNNKKNNKVKSKPLELRSRVTRKNLSTTTTTTQNVDPAVQVHVLMGKNGEIQTSTNSTVRKNLVSF